MPSEKFFVHKEDGSLVRLKGRLVRFLDEEPPTGSDKSAIRTALEVSPDAEGLVQADVGTDPQNLVLHGHLGTMAYQSSDGVSMVNAEVETLEVTDKVTGPLTVSNTSAATSFILANSGGGTTLNFAVTENTGGIIDASEGASARNILFKTGGTERVRIDSSGGLQLKTSGAEIALFNDLTYPGTSRAFIGCEGRSGTFNYGGDLVVKLRNDDYSISERARFTQNGLCFNGDTAAANALDDYETGTWTPVFTSQTGSFTTMTMSASGEYTKIGNMVHVRAFIRTNGVNLSGGSGILYISGLPFTSVAKFASISVGFAYGWVNAPAGAYVLSGSSRIVLTKRLTSITGNLNDSATTDLDTSSGILNQIVIGGCYEAA